MISGERILNRLDSRFARDGQGEREGRQFLFLPFDSRITPHKEPL